MLSKVLIYFLSLLLKKKINSNYVSSIKIKIKKYLCRCCFEDHESSGGLGWETIYLRFPSGGDIFIYYLL